MTSYKWMLIFVLTSFHVYSQNIDYKQITEIARMEQQAHYRLENLDKLTGASANFDVKHYRCEWEVDPAIRYITGKVTILFKLNENTTSISLDLMNSGLITDSIKYHAELLNFVHTHDVLQLTFTSSLHAGDYDSITVYYQGVPPNTGFGSFVQTVHLGVPIIWTLSEPYGSRDWWPCKNGLDDKADSIDVFITAPSIYNAASNGLLQEETYSGNKKITHWKHRYPIATYLVCFAITNYAIYNSSVQLGPVSVPLVTYCWPENIQLFQANTPLVPGMMQFYSSAFGSYPFIKEKYGQVQFGWGGGQEHQTSTFIVTPNEGLMAHELAHQWFGDKVTCRSWADIWLNEGFATFLASYYSESKYPANTLAVRKNEIAAITAFPGGSVWVDDTTNVNRIFDGRLSYNKGSHLLYMLRWKLGDSAFFNGLKSYLSDPKVSFGFASTSDLQRNLEFVSGQNLSEFFRDWFYGQGYPSYMVNWSQLGSDHVKVLIRQVTSDPSVTFFPMPLALLFKNPTQQKTIVFDHTMNNQEFIRNIGFIADTVIIDPEYWLITKNNISAKENDIITNDHSVEVFPNPLHDVLSVYFRQFEPGSISMNIFNSSRQVLYNRDISINNTEFIEIPMKTFARGVYFLSIKSNKGFSLVKKIVKE